MRKRTTLIILLSLLSACTMPFARDIAAGPAVEVQNTAEAIKSTAENTAAIEHTPTVEYTPTVEHTPLPKEITAPLLKSPSIASIDMLDEVYGWALTETQVIRTNDGGAAWYDVTPEGISEVGYGASTEFMDVDHAWIQFPDPNNFPNAGILYRTSDGGMTWTSTATPFNGGDISFVDANNGWMMADLGAGAGSMAVSIFQTKDGGGTWNRTYTNDPNLEGSGDTLPLGGLKGWIVPLDMQTAWVGGVVYAPGTVYLFRTDDAGKTWFRINLVLPPQAESADLAVEGLRFASSTAGILVLRIRGENGPQTLIYRTNDGGNTWTPAPAGVPDSGRLEIVSAQEIVLYGSDQFYVTRDAAQTWNLVPPDIVFGESLTGMSFVNSSSGWVITTDPSNRRILYKTTDGGATWYPLAP